VRFILGIIVGCAITIAGAYVTDATAPAAGKMVNWDVVAKHVDAVTALAREGWKKITG
jgi:gas vesicle protein